jgi:hypothetical protein
LTFTPTEPVVFHIPGSVLHDAALLGDAYGKMALAIEALGAKTRFIVHDRVLVAEQIQQDAGFHILDHGRLRHHRVLNCGTAYIAPFRYLDPFGIRSFSSLADQVFDPARIPEQPALAFQTRLYRRLAQARKSRYPQPETVLDIPSGCIAVFLQTEAHRNVDETCFLTLREMVGALLARSDPRPIVIKPHPRDTDLETLEWLGMRARGDPRVLITLANIHDILRVCDVVVTINSAVGMEAFVHSNPVVWCGKADFHHCAETAWNGVVLDAALARAERRTWPYAAFLTWFYRRKCIDPRSPTLGMDIYNRIADHGFDPAILGMQRPV